MTSPIHLSVKTVSAPDARSAPTRTRFHARTLRDGRRLYWWVEVIFILVFYAVYSAIRNASEGGEVEAFRHARQLVGWERGLGLAFEETVQDWALNFRPLVIVTNYIYGSLHFIVTAGAIIYLFRSHSDDYPRWRNTLATTTALALIGFILWPLMPPRLLPGQFAPGETPARYDYVDTLAEYPTFWSFDSGAMQEVSNQYAAMPSLHFAWSTFCAVALVPRVRRRRLKWALASYPAVTLLAIVLTANHYWLDAVGGLVVLGAGLLIGKRLTPGAASPAVA
ncbi:MAG: phosphatase PAP2 family protein [Actinobacteria bacterium]|nr:phosphatase PAP2 family protein [Actinomycetota bacterium]